MLLSIKSAAKLIVFIILYNIIEYFFIFFLHFNLNVFIYK
jgi:hypothetical protein